MRKFEHIAIEMLEQFREHKLNLKVQRKLKSVEELKRVQMDEIRFRCNRFEELSSIVLDSINQPESYTHWQRYYQGVMENDGLWDYDEIEEVLNECYSIAY